jgi:hypothetical protein
MRWDEIAFCVPAEQCGGRGPLLTERMEAVAMEQAARGRSRSDCDTHVPPDRASYLASQRSG